MQITYIHRESNEWPNNVLAVQRYGYFLLPMYNPNLNNYLHGGPICKLVSLCVKEFMTKLLLVAKVTTKLMLL